MTDQTEYETTLTGRLVELRYPNGSGGFDADKPKGRVVAVTPGKDGMLWLWLEIEDAEGVASLSWPPPGPQIGDIVKVATSRGYGEAVIRLIQERPTPVALSNQLNNHPGTRGLVRRIMRHLEIDGELTPLNLVTELLGASRHPYQLIILTDPQAENPVHRVYINFGPHADPDPGLLQAIEDLEHVAEQELS